MWQSLFYWDSRRIQRCGKSHLLYFWLSTSSLWQEMFSLQLPSLSAHYWGPQCTSFCVISFIDACYSCVDTPKLVIDSLYEKKTSTFKGCMTQIFWEHFLTGVGIILLTSMVYDCYMTICKPLHNKTIMNWWLCWLLVRVAWMGSFLHGIIQILFIIRLPFCGPTVIDHFMCDQNLLLELACTDTHTLGLYVAANSGILCLLNFLLLAGSYVVIFHSLRTKNSEARRKDLSTCVSHITAVVIFFVPCIFVYMRSAVILPIDKSVAVFYTMITPMLNPLIYTLRNAQLKTTIRKCFISKAISGEI